MPKATKQQKTETQHPLAAQFGFRLRELREAAGMTQQELATRANLSIGAVRQWEQSQREPSLSSVLILADALDVEVTEFLKKPRSAEPQGRGRPPRPAEGAGNVKRRGKP